MWRAVAILLCAGMEVVLGLGLYLIARAGASFSAVSGVLVFIDALLVTMVGIWAWMCENDIRDIKEGTWTYKRAPDFPKTVIFHVNQL